jgi:NhaA family Na+:H+ antiporter
VTLVEYGDYQCGYCRRAHRGVARLRDELAAGQVRLVYRHLPNRRVHEHAELAAQAAEAAAARGRFWEMHERLLSDGSQLDREGLIAAAADIGLDVESFARELDAGTHADRVEEDVRSAELSGAHATPTFYVDGRRYDGPWDMESLLEAVRKPLGWRLRLLAEQFAGLSTSSGLLMLVGVVAALLWVNSPWGEGYTRLWQAPLEVGVGAWGLEMELGEWVNDGLIVLFFLVVALEIRREVTVGELASLRGAALPFAAAVGGMLAPALLYLLFNGGTSTARGWGVPMGTDTAFALGVLAILGSRVPLSLRVFVAAAAIADDVASIAVIAVFYTEDIVLSSLAMALLLWAVALACNRARIYRPLPYVVIGLLLWLAVLDAGVHPTLAGVLLAFAIPTRSEPIAGALLAQSQSLLQSIETPPIGEVTPARHQAALQALEGMVERLLSPAQRVARELEPWSAYFVLPVFAFSNAGVELRMDPTDFLQPVSLGIVTGLLVGKPLGIAGGAWLAVQAGVATKPSDVKWWHVVGAGMLCGIGFTMSFFIAGLAFADEETLALAKISVLATSMVAGVGGWGILYWWNERRRRRILRRNEGTEVATPSSD